ncbi:MAG: ABC transporter ATP-binding protein [Actinomycetota bacterium]|nr:ABC transporter ATP-binding protein [Actinomycetota bacterium]
METDLMNYAYVEEDKTEDEIVKVTGLNVWLRRGRQDSHILKDVDLAIKKGEIVALVGESGSGKSVLGMTLLGLLPRSSTPKVDGKVSILGSEMTSISRKELRNLRRHSISGIFQDPMSSLNPSMKIATQMKEVTSDLERAVEALVQVAIKDPKSVLGRFPFQLSGGQRQRVMIAMALAKEPALIVADEPTTALDVTVQAQILFLIKQLRRNFETGFLFVTHDLGVASEIADSVVVLLAGRVLEKGPTADILSRPAHPYTRELISSRLTMDQDQGLRLRTNPRDQVQAVVVDGCPYATRCENALEICHSQFPTTTSVGDGWTIACHNPTPRSVSGDLSLEVQRRKVEGEESKIVVLEAVAIEKTFRSRESRAEATPVLVNVDLELHQGEVVSLVGESGSGKSTFLRILAGLEEATSGTLVRNDNVMPKMVFQDSGSSLTPWLTVRELLREAISAKSLSKAEIEREVEEVAAKVDLSTKVLASRAASLSGGQRQRVAIARCVISPPSILLCDEPTSALDASLVAGTLNLLLSLSERLQMAMVFVTHDLAVARYVSSRIMVMLGGRIVESGDSDEVCAKPLHPYTRMLLQSLPGEGNELKASIAEMDSELTSVGCAFSSRCPEAMEICRTTPPQVVHISRQRYAACHLLEGGLS